MTQTAQAFQQLFQNVVEKCFGSNAPVPLSESDSKLLSSRIFEATGLVIGPKTLRNYSLYIESPADSKKENPSIATLDTLARYVLDAPKTDETSRKEKEAHFPYWFKYRDSLKTKGVPKIKKLDRKTLQILVAACLVVAALLVGIWWLKGNEPDDIHDNFTNLSPDSLSNRGWILKNQDGLWWNKRIEKPGHITLFTLPGDNWGNDTSRIRNLLVRQINADCFSTEVHFSDFVPQQNWQQAGILLSEDSLFRDKVIRLSISYNDFFGGYKKPPEIIIQAVTSDKTGARSIPEEIAHALIFNLDSGFQEIVRKNLSRSALKIEKHGKHIRLLYTAGEMETFAFKEVVSGDFNLEPKYLGLFASQGLSNKEVIPVYVDSFRFGALECGE